MCVAFYSFFSPVFVVLVITVLVAVDVRFLCKLLGMYEGKTSFFGHKNAIVKIDLVWICQMC